MFNPLKFFGDIMIVFVLALVGGLTYFIVQGNLSPALFTNMTAYPEILVITIKNIFPIAILMAFVIAMIIQVFGQPKLPQYPQYPQQYQNYQPYQPRQTRRNKKQYPNQPQPPMRF